MLVVDKVGHIPFNPEAANLMFSLVSNERASLIDRLIHHPSILSRKGDSYRLHGKDPDTRPVRTPEIP